MPTSEWKAATSSGIEVIGTRRAITAPTLPPMAMPRMTSTQATPSAGGWTASVVATAIAMPIMPNRLPWRDVAGLDRPRSDRMNSTPATRYRIAARLAFISDPHCLRHHEVHAVRLPFHLAFFLYIASMRWVTRKPPKMFTQAKISAMKPKPRAQPVTSGRQPASISMEGGHGYGTFDGCRYSAQTVLHASLCAGAYRHRARCPAGPFLPAPW